MNEERLFRGTLACTVCAKSGVAFKRDSALLMRNSDGTFSAYCHEHQPAGVYQNDDLTLIETNISFPWRWAGKITLHKMPATPPFDRRGDIVTVEAKPMRDVQMSYQVAIELTQVLMLMSDERWVVHRWGEDGEQNDCWIVRNWGAPSVTIRHKYWGEESIDRFRRVCRLACEIHGIELVDETLDVLDRIVQAIDDGDQPKTKVAKTKKKPTKKRAVARSKNGR
ncbi:MAG: hypothetical protein AB7L09_02770 [Nitrospira sp.]